MDEVAYLIGKTYQTDEIGNQISVSTKRKIYVSVGSVTQYEFYAAAQVGLKPDFRLKTFYLDYQANPLWSIKGKSMPFIERIPTKRRKPQSCI